MNLFEPMHLLILALVLLLFFGGRKIPELMRGIGQGVGELQKGLNDAKKTMTVAMDQESTPTTKTEPAAIQANATAVPAPAETQQVRQA